jgi:hypothetical protein
MKLVFIYGPPASGKLTVAEALGRLTGINVWHNHLSIDAVSPLFDYGTRPYGRLVEQIRRDIFEVAAEVGMDIIFTYVYVHPHDTNQVGRFCEVIERAGGAVCPVQLTCSRETLLDRVQAVRRSEVHKIDSVDVLETYLAEHDTSQPLPGRDSLIIDTATTSPDEAALLIARHYDLPIAP